MSIVSDLITAFSNVPFTVKQAYEKCPNVNKDSVRARIYENLGAEFVKLGRGLYKSTKRWVIFVRMHSSGK